MSQVTNNIARYIREKGIQISKISEDNISVDKSKKQGK